MVSLTICSQKSTPTRLSWKMLWSNMYSAASPRLTIHSAMCRRPDAERHVLRVGGAGGVVVAADAADAAGDEVRVARVLALHEDAVAAEDRRRAVALGDLAVLEVDLGVDAQAADDPGDRIPVHLDQVPALGRASRSRSSVMVLIGVCSSARHMVRGRVTGGELGARMPPLRLLVERGVGELPQRGDRAAVDRRPSPSTPGRRAARP